MAGVFTQVVVVLVALGVGLALGVVLLRRRPGDDGSLTRGISDEVALRVRHELDAQRLALEEQRSSSLNEAVQSIVTIASEQLAQHSRAGALQLDERNEAVAQRLDEMGRALERVRSLMGEMDQQRAEGFGQIAERLEQTGRMTGELTRTTQALAEALASPQARGQWGERMAEDVLRTAGFVRGVNYLVQQSSKEGRPDYTFPLPAGRCVHMDVKFPLDNYVRHLNAATDDEQARALKAFLRDVRNRINEVSRRDYIDPGNGTLDQVLLFLPNEHIYGFLHQADAGLLDAALQQKVVLCSPLTLFAVLAVIRQSVDDHLTEQRSAEILDLLGGFATQWQKFTDHLDRLDARLHSTRKAFDEVNGPRRRQLERHLDRIDDVRSASMDDLGEPAEVLTLLERDDSQRSVAG